MLDLAPVVLDGGDAQVAVAEALLPPSTCSVTPRPHPAPTSVPAREASLVEAARLAQEAGVLGVVVDATVAHDQGASDVQELGYSMAVAAAYLRELTEAGFTARRGGTA